MVETLTDPEKDFFRHYGVVMLKPDTIELFLENMFIRDFEELGLVTMYRQLLLLSENDLTFIYPEWVCNKEKFSAIKANMTEGQSMLFILKNVGGLINSGDMQDLIRRLKGRANEPGLRNKYIHIFENELMKLYPEHDLFLRELNKNRIHSPDTCQEALGTLVYLWPRIHQESIASNIPKLCDIIAERLRITPLYVAR